MSKHIRHLVIILICTGNVFGQERSVHPKREVLLPEFYHSGASRNGDTTFQYELYDQEDKLISVFALQNINEIEHINYVANYYGYPNNGGNISAPLLTATLLAYTKIDSNTWERFDRTNAQSSYLKEHKNKITRADTISFINPTTKSKELIVEKYYKVEEAKGMKGIPHEHTHKH